MAFKDFALYDQKKMYKYAAGDADATRRLFFVFLKQLKDEGLLEYFKSPVMALSKNLIFSAMHGVKIDYDRVKTLSGVISTSRDFYLDKMIIFLADVNFTPRSNPALRKILFTDLKLDYLTETGKGLPSTSAEAIDEVRKLNPQNKKGLEFLDFLALYRKLDKLLSTYLNKILGFCDADGYCHPRFIVGATVSGRVSVKDPPLTTLPKDTEYETIKGRVLISIRSVFIPSKDSVWIHADYSQIELVVSAFLSRDPVMMADFKAHRDIHEQTMKTANGIDYISEEEATGDVILTAKRASQRRDAKVINFSIIYMAKPYNTARILGYPVEKIEDIMDKMFEKYCVLHKYLLSVPAIVAREGQLKSPFGRVRHFPPGSLTGGAQGHQDRQAVNWGPQSCGAEITFRALNRISEKLREMKLRSLLHGLVYDAIEADALRRELELVRSIIIQEMSRPVPQFDNFSFPFELGVGVNMSDAENNTKKVHNAFKYT